jgi:hypothetical protein
MLQRSQQSLRCRSDCMRLHAITCNCMQSDAIACNVEAISKKNLCLRLSEFLKIHWEQEAGLKVCQKCFFTTTVNRFIIIIFFAFLKKEEMRSGTHFTQQTCFFLEKSSSSPRAASVPIRLHIYEFIYFGRLVLRQIFLLIAFSFPVEPQVHALLY